MALRLRRSYIRVAVDFGADLGEVLKDGHVVVAKHVADLAHVVQRVVPEVRNALGGSALDRGRVLQLLKSHGKHSAETYCTAH